MHGGTDDHYHQPVPLDKAFEKMRNLIAARRCMRKMPTIQKGSGNLPANLHGVQLVICHRRDPEGSDPTKLKTDRTGLQNLWMLVVGQV
jgi:hypothetical protein